MQTELYREGWALIGHNRKATRGTIIPENAHPFWVEDKTVLVHNGSFNGSHKHLKDTNVDSEAIAHLLAEHGQDDIAGALQRVNAAYALIWYDVASKSVNFLRNPERPLSWVETDTAWYFASEASMLRYVLDRNGIKPLKEVFTFPDYCHNKWTLLEDKSCTVESEMLDCKYRYTPVATSQPTSDVAPWRGHRHPYACAWNEWGDAEYAETVVPTTKEVATQVETKVELPVTTKADKPVEITVMPWFPRITLRKAQAGLFEAYKQGTKVKVVVDDYLDVDPKDNEVLVTGKTLDAESLPVAFKLSRKSLDSLTNPQNVNLDNAVFEVTVRFPSWRRTDARVLHDSNDAEGVMILNAHCPELRFDGMGHGTC